MKNTDDKKIKKYVEEYLNGTLYYKILKRIYKQKEEARLNDEVFLFYLINSVLKKRRFPTCFRRVYNISSMLASTCHGGKLS